MSLAWWNLSPINWQPCQKPLCPRNTRVIQFHNARTSAAEDCAMTYPPPTRKRAGIAILLGLGGLCVNHWMMEFTDRFSPMLMIIVPVVLFQGLAGLIEPRLLYAFSEEGRDYPQWLKNVGGMLVLAGIAAGAAIAHFVYGFWQ